MEGRTQGLIYGGKVGAQTGKVGGERRKRNPENVPEKIRLGKRRKSGGGRTGKGFFGDWRNPRKKK